MKWLSWNRKGGKKKESDVPIFHGSNSIIRPEEFDFDRADPSSDFGRGAYFSFRYNNARDWALRKNPAIVNSYVFHEDDARNDPGIVIEELDDDLEWLNRIIRIYMGLEEPDSIMIGKIMDGRTGRIIQHYEEKAWESGKNLLTMDDSLKYQMIRDLKPDRIGKQIVFHKKEDLRHVEYIDSIEVASTKYPRIIDPSDIAADVAILLSIRDNIPRKDALAAFMRSDTFRHILEDESMADIDSEEALELYRKEVSRRV